MEVAKWIKRESLLAVVGSDRENGHERGHGSQGGESPELQRGKLERGLEVDVMRLTQSGAALDSSRLPLHSPLTSPFAPDMSVKEVDCLLLFFPLLPSPFLAPVFGSY